MLSLLAIAFGLGLLAGALTNGRISGLTLLQFRWTPVLFVALAIGMIPLFVDLSEQDTLRRGLTLLTYLGVLAFLIANITTTRAGVRAGLAIVGAGWLLNFLPIVANGGMPLSMWAFERSGQGGTPTPGKSGFFKIVIADENTVLRPLGDVIPVPALRQVISIGDILLIVGIAVLMAAGMHLRARGRAADGAPRASA